MAQKLVNHRTARGLTQRRFATQIGVDPSTLARWERAERSPDSGQIRKLNDGGLSCIPEPRHPEVRCIHMGDITELGNLVAGAFLHPEQAGHVEYLPLVGDFMSFNEIVETLNREGHEFSFKQVPKEVFATLFPGAAEIGEMFSYFQAHTYSGSDSSDRIALANKIVGRQPARFSMWARLNVPVQKP